MPLYKRRNVSPDFKEQKKAIQELVLSRDHFCIFLSKFHPELNFIERY